MKTFHQVVSCLPQLQAIGQFQDGKPQMSLALEWLLIKLQLDTKNSYIKYSGEGGDATS